MKLDRWKILSSVCWAWLASTVGCQQVDPAKELVPLVDSYVKVWNTGDVAALNPVADPQFTLYMSPKFQPVRGLDSLKETIARTRALYPDFFIRIDESIFAQDAVAARWTITATDAGKSEPSLAGKQVKVQGMSILHVKGGKIIDEWVFANDLAWLDQLGFSVVPTRGKD